MLGLPRRRDTEMKGGTHKGLWKRQCSCRFPCQIRVRIERIERNMTLKRKRSGRAPQRTGTLHAFALLRRVRHFPKIAAPLHVEPEFRAVAEHASQDKRRRRRYIPSVAAQFFDMLALNAHRLGERSMRYDVLLNDGSTSYRLAGIETIEERD